ncbi:MAG: DUF5522 domain-containing protein [bacterium]|nr:DUF5522 domain-containing protein [bacterium]
MENGMFVMTSCSHLKPGYCGGSGCRHCPYPKGQLYHFPYNGMKTNLPF